MDLPAHMPIHTPTHLHNVDVYDDVDVDADVDVMVCLYRVAIQVAALRHSWHHSLTSGPKPT